MTCQKVCKQGRDDIINNDIITQAAIGHRGPYIVKGEIDLHKQLLLVWNKTRSVDTVR